MLGTGIGKRTRRRTAMLRVMPRPFTGEEVCSVHSKLVNSLAHNKETHKRQVRFVERENDNIHAP